MKAKVYIGPTMSRQQKMIMVIADPTQQTFLGRTISNFDQGL